MSLTMSTHYFTFGSDHSYEGTNLRNRYVAVEAPIVADHRALFMGIFGRDFSSEYVQTEFSEYCKRYAPTEFMRIAVQISDDQ